MPGGYGRRSMSWSRAAPCCAPARLGGAGALPNASYRPLHERCSQQPVGDLGNRASGRREGRYGVRRGYFLQGRTATTRRHARRSGEQYELVESAVFPMRAMTHQRLRCADLPTYPGTFPRLLDATQRAVWPFEEKLGARPTGRWKVFYLDANSRTEESPDYDEMITMTRYASYSHYQAMQPGRAALHGGNGPDWRAWRDAVDEGG